MADAAATLVANAVNLDSPAVLRRPACELDPDSDLRSLPVTVSVGPLTPAEVDAALAAGLAQALNFRERGLIAEAALMLAGLTRTLGEAYPTSDARGPIAGTRSPPLPAGAPIRAQGAPSILRVASRSTCARARSSQ